MDRIAINLPDPFILNPVAQRLSIRGGTQSAVEDFTVPAFYNYPTNEFLTNIIRPSFGYYALVEQVSLEV